MTMELSPSSPNSASSLVFRALAVVFLVLCLALLPGCWGKLELEERSFVTLMGLDRAKDGRLLATVVIAVPRALGKGGGGMSGGGMAGASLILSGSGRNIEEALRDIELQNARELSTVYLTFVILGEELAKTDVSPIMDVFSRHLHYKPNTLIAICKGGAYAFLTGSETLEEVEPSQSILKLITSAHDTVSACPMVTVHDFMVGYNTISIDPWAPYIGLVSTASAEQAAEEKSKPAAGSTGPGDAKQGQNDPNAKKIVKVLGTAVFSKVGAETKMVGSLDTWESLAALILRGDLRTGFINIAYPGDQAETTLLIQRAATSEDLSLNDGSVEVKFKIVATMSISESAVGKEILPEKEQQFRQAIVRTAEEQLLSLVQRTFLKLTALDSDVLGIGRSAQTMFRTYGEWEAFDWNAKYPRSTASFDIKVHIFTAGFTLEKPFPR